MAVPAPASVFHDALPSDDDVIIKFTNCRLADPASLSLPGSSSSSTSPTPNKLVSRDVWVSRATGRILDPQATFFTRRGAPSEVRDCGGRILAPGFLDVQLNGAFGFDFSVPAEHADDYAKGLREVNRQLVRTGVTSYLPTVTSQKPEVYHKVLPHLGARTQRDGRDGAESLGAHCEGPFLNPERNGIHKKEVLQTPSLAALEACYGAEHLHPATIRKITLAPELDSDDHEVVRALVARGIIHSAGHSAATYAQIAASVRAGTTMVTHMFNAMNQPHHRHPGIFGILGAPEVADAGVGGAGSMEGAGEKVPRRPFFGLIADDVHVHPSYVRLAWNAYSAGCILVTDAMAMLGLRDGTYTWTNGDVIRKNGYLLTLGDSATIAGSVITLPECVSNLLRWTDADVVQAIGAVTATPARMLGLEGIKGSLAPGADADLVLLSGGKEEGLTVEEVWKFGTKVYDRDAGEGVLGKISARL